MMKSLGPADQEILGREDFRQMFAQNVAEAFRQGGRGPAHDYALEARPWGVPLGQIQVPIEIWHGEDDRLVSPQASRILAAAVPDATTHFVPGEVTCCWPATTPKTLCNPPSAADAGEPVPMRQRPGMQAGVPAHPKLRAGPFPQRISSAFAVSGVTGSTPLDIPQSPGADPPGRAPSR